AQQRAWPSFDMRKHPVTDLGEVAREIELGNRASTTMSRPEFLFRLRNGDAEHAFAIGLRGSTLGRTAGTGSRAAHGPCRLFGRAPDSIGLEGARATAHERARARALAGRDLRHRATGRNRAILLEHVRLRL